MNITVDRYELPAANKPFTLNIPSGSVLLNVKLNAGIPHLFTLSPSFGLVEPRTFEVIQTTLPYPTTHRYITTFEFKQPRAAFHLFEIQQL